MIFVCHQAGSSLSPLMAATAGVKTSATTATSATFQETPALHCGQHPLVWSHLDPRLPHPDQQHRHHLASRLQEDFCLSDWPQARVSKCFSGQPECVHLLCASSTSSNTRTTQWSSTSEPRGCTPFRRPLTTFNHNADNVSTFGCSLRSVFLGRASVDSMV